MSDKTTPEDAVDTTLESIRYVGPATAAVLDSNGFGPTAITDKRVSYRMLVDAGVNSGVAAKIRREHSLSWSFRSSGDLNRRSTQVRGLGTAEAEWVAASVGDWEQESNRQSTAEQPTETAETTNPVDNSDPTDSESTARTPWPTHGLSTTETPTTASTTAEKTTAHTVTDGSGDAISAEAAWRARSKPTPVTDLDVVDNSAADLLAEAGITSVRSLATADPARIASVLELPSDVVETWYQCAREVYD